MDEETFETAKENDLSFDEAEQLQEVIDETGLDAEEQVALKGRLRDMISLNQDFAGFIK